MRRDGLVVQLAVPTFIVGFTGQVISLSARIAVSYQAVNMGLSPFAVLVLSSSFAFVPIFLAVSLGRYTDRNGAGPVVLFGSVLMALGAAAPLLITDSVFTLAVSMAMMGVGQTLQIAALQSEISLVPRSRQRDRMIGSFMVYQSLGQIVAPIMLSGIAATTAGPLYRNLMIAALIVAVVQLAASLPILRAARRPLPQQYTMPISKIVATPGLVWLAVAGSLCVAAQDVVYVYTPVVGSERGISPSAVGFALGGFAATQMLSRVLYARLAKRYGRLSLMNVGLVITCASLVAISFPGGFILLTLVLLVAGLALGLGVTSAVSLTMQHAPVAAKATTLSLRLAANRTAQFVVPLLAGAVAPWLGTGAVFAALGGLVGASLAAVPMNFGGSKKKRSEK